MNFEEWKKLENDALKVIEDFGVAGVRVQAPQGAELSSLQRVVALRKKARAMDAHPDPDPVLAPDDERRAVQLSGDSANEVQPVPVTSAMPDDDASLRELHELLAPLKPRASLDTERSASSDDDISLSELVAQLERPIPVRINPGNERELLPWKTRQERSAEEWLTNFERFIEEMMALPPRERGMQISILRDHLHTVMSAAERRAVDLPPGDPRLARLDRLLGQLELFLQEHNPATPLRAAVVRHQEERQRIGDEQPQSDLDFYTRCAAECTRLS